ncbi:unnamed protein product, partial [Thlaspi arvense]
MSQLLSRVLKPLVCKNVIRHNNQMVRLFSSMQQMYPYVLVDHVLKVGEEIRNSIGYSLDPLIDVGIGTSSVQEIVIKDKELKEDVRDAMNVRYYQNDDRFEVSMYSDQSYLSDIDNVRLHLCMYHDPLNPNASPKELRLPYLPTGTQIQNVAMSICQRDEDTNIEDLVVAVKIKIYSPASHVHDFRWIDIETTNESISPFSCLMHKDQKFYIPTPGGEYLCSFDPNVKEKDKPELIRLWTNPLPSSLLYDLSDLAIKRSRTDHLVESPTGEQFHIKYYGDHKKHYHCESFEQKTKRFMVFKEEGPSTDKKGKMMSYTEDIGDLCIFLGRNEAFCVQASSSLGLRPNCIYFVGYNYGVFGITTQLCTIFTTKEGPLRSTDFPYWHHPLSITTN